MNEVLNNFFEIMSKNNKIGHAFLLCNTNYEIISEQLNEIISKYLFNNQKIDENFFDLKIIRPVNDQIVKEDIINLQEEFKNKSQYNKNKVYIIDHAEKMNDYASNSLLKFLEEPQENIYAFLITENINKVLLTIKSRCQVLMISNYNDFNLDIIENELVDKSIELVKLIEIKKKYAIGYIYDIIDKKEERKTINNLLNIIKYFYLDMLYSKIGKNINYFKDYASLVESLSSSNSIESIVEKLLIVCKEQNKLNYNLNVNLFLDNLLLQLGGVKNE